VLRQWRNWQTHQLEGQKPLSLQLLCHQRKSLIPFNFTLEHVGADLRVLEENGRKMVTATYRAVTVPWKITPWRV
jgi:hypothetical protein